MIYLIFSYILYLKMPPQRYILDILPFWNEVSYSPFSSFLELDIPQPGADCWVGSGDFQQYSVL